LGRLDAPEALSIVQRLATNSPFALAKDAATFSLAKRTPRTATETVASSTAKAPPLSEEEQKRFEFGKSIYELTCLACHQGHGRGQEGLAPPLVDSEWVAGSEQRLIRMVLQGIRGPIQVKGQRYEMDMPALGVLDDEQIAGALTYIRRAWGHGFTAVHPDTVKKVREATADRVEGWTAEDLKAVP
jgi:mono/diheme cytochrome c family protein